MKNFTADDGSFYYPNNLRSNTPLKVVRLADNKSQDDSAADFQEPYNLFLHFNRTILITVIILVCVFWFIALLSFFARRRARRFFGQAGADNINYWNGTQGLDRAVIGSFPIFSYNSVKALKAHPKCSDCAVCLTDFKDHEMLRLLPKCRHAFHPECIDLWLSSHTTCPVCRTNLLPGDDSAPTVTDFDVIRPPTPPVPPEEVTVVVENEHRSTDNGNDEATIENSGHDSTEFSLLRVHKELEQGSQWYIATGESLTPGLHWSCSFVTNRTISQEPSSSNAPPTWSKLGESVVDTGRKSTSERWGSVSVRPPCLERSYSERYSSEGRDGMGSEQQEASFDEDVELVDGKRRTRRREGVVGVLNAVRSKRG